VLVALLEGGEVLMHPFVIGEIACGNLKRRSEIIMLMQALPSSHKADDGEIVFLVERHGLHGTGLGLVDVHLLAACLMDGCLLWTADRRFKSAADRLGIAFEPA
jgi:predicted nucleic acid-binding protein